MPAQTVGFGSSINPYSVELADVERRRKLAEALQQQGTTPLGNTEMLGQVAIQRSPLEGIGKLGQVAAGAYGQKKASEQERAVGERYQSDLNSALAQALKAGTGSPATTLPDDVQGPNMPAQAPDRARMAQILMQHPATQGLGTQQMMTDMSRQALVAALGGGSQAAPQPQSGGAPPASGPASAPQAPGAATGGPAGGVPMAAWLQSDPTGKSYMEQLAKDNMKASEPVIDRGFGIKRLNPLTGKYDLASNPEDITTIESAKLRGQTPNKLITVNTEGAPTLMTEEQAIQAAGGRQLPQGTTVAPTVTLADIAKIADPQERAAAQAALQKTPGLRLQDQGESAKQKKEGEELAQLRFEAPIARRSVSDASANLDRLEAEARKVYNDPALTRITGLMGSIPNIPGSAASDVSAKLGALKSQIGISVLQSMREASKTGGALGAISDKENELLQRNLAALDQNQSVAAFKKNLEQVMEYAKGAKSRLENAYRDQYQRVQGDQGMTPTAQGAIPTSAVIGGSLSPQEQQELAQLRARFGNGR